MTLALANIGDYRDARGRTPVDPAIFLRPGSEIISGRGQSMRANYGELVPINPMPGTVYELCHADGLIYEVTEGYWPTMGVTGWDGVVGSSWSLRRCVMVYHATMRVLRRKAERVLLALPNVGGTTAYQFSPSGSYYSRATGVLLHLISLGIPPTMWLEVQGQGDVLASNFGAATSAQNYSDIMNAGWVALRGLGLTCPILMGQGAYWGFSVIYPDRHAMVKAGQILAVQDAARNDATARVIIGPDDDEWPNWTGWRVDGVHQADYMKIAEEQRWNDAYPDLP